MTIHDPSPSEQRLASTHDGRSEIRARLSDLAKAAMHFGKTVLDDFFCLGVVANECVRETHHANILGMEQVLDRLGAPLLRCIASITPNDVEQYRSVADLATILVSTSPGRPPPAPASCQHSAIH
ncbi:MAG: hypothetical protein V3V01_15045 [Acidimicrobiales bacterium]